MRTADDNRIKRSIAKLKEIRQILKSIKWENLSSGEYALLQSVNRRAEDFEWSLTDLFNESGRNRCKN